MATPEEHQAEALRKLGERMGGTIESTKNLSDRLDTLNKSFRTQGDTLVKARRVVDQVNLAGMTNVQRIKDQIEGLKRLDALWGETLGNTDAFKRGIDRLNESISRGKSGARGEFISALAGTSQTTQQVGSALGSLTQKYDDVKKGAANLAGYMEKGLGQTLIRAAGPLAPVIIAAGFALDFLVKKISEAQDITRIFGGTVFSSSVGVNTFRRILIKNTADMAIHNIQADQLGKVYEILTRSYGLSATQALKFAGSLDGYVEQITPAIVQTMAMGRVSGLTDEQTGKLISTFGLLGEDLRGSNELFATLDVRAKASGISTSDLTRAITTLGTGNIFTEKSIEKTSRTLSGYAHSIMTSNSALLTGANRAAVAATAMNSVAEAANRMDLPTMLGFGAALDGMTGSLDDAVTKVATMDRVDIFARAMKEITARVEPGSQLIARTLMAQQLGIQDVNTALMVGTGTLKDQKRNQAEALREQEAIRRAGGDLTRISARTSNRLDDIHGILLKFSQSVVGSIMSLSLPRGRGEEAPAMTPIARITQPGMAASAAGGTPQ